MSAWKCPVCSYVWAEWVAGCMNCNKPSHEKMKYGTTTNPTPSVPYTPPYTPPYNPNDTKIWSSSVGGVDDGKHILRYA